MAVRRFFRQRAFYTLAVLSTFITAVGMPGLIPALASADTVTSRSINLSSSAAGDTGVTYDVAFTAVAATATGFLVEFCSNSAVTFDSCTTPTGFDASTATTATSGYTAADFAVTPTDNHNIVSVSKTTGDLSSVDVALTGITNPTDAGTLYARVVTYATLPSPTAFDVTSTSGSPLDTGGFVLGITNAVGVSASVAETLTFCVANQTISQDCGDASTAGHQPNITLPALTQSGISTGSIFTQLSTNANGGAIVSLKSGDNTCGTLKIVSGTTHCLALADGTTDANGVEFFGIKTGTGTGTTDDGDASGTLEAVTDGSYNSTHYYLGSGVTSTYGDPLLDTDNAVVNNQNMQLTFGGSVTGATPAGNYHGTYGLIASAAY